jgi:hypothetical protein
MRLYLRSGRVVPRYNAVGDALMGKPRPRPRLVKLLREAVGEALRATARFSGLTVADVNYVEWQLGRSVCDHIKPACLKRRIAPGLDNDIGCLFDRFCPYMNFCKACADEEWRKLKEPQFKSTFY